MPIVVLTPRKPRVTIMWRRRLDPPVASGLSMAQLAAILNETAPNQPYLAAYQLTTTDAHGAIASAAPLKVAPTDDPAHPYLGVFHNPINTTQFATYLGYSNDLKTWHTLGEIHQPASQPDIRILADDSVLYAEEYNPSDRPTSECNIMAMTVSAASRRSSPILPSHRRMH